MARVLTQRPTRILRGDILWADLDPVRGREQAGRRPILVLSHDVFNERSGTVIALARAASRFSDWMDRHVWDGLVRMIGQLGQILGLVSRQVDERGINAGVDETMTGTRGLGRVMSRWHSGQIQTYLGAVAVGMLALLILYAWLT